MILVGLIIIVFCVKLLEMLVFGDEEEARRTLDELLEEEAELMNEDGETREVSKR